MFDEALVDEARSIIASVSYTHLDVYKRQGLPLPNPGHATRNRLRGRRLPTLPLYPEPLP